MTLAGSCARKALSNGVVHTRSPMLSRLRTRMRVASPASAIGGPGEALAPRPARQLTQPGEAPPKAVPQVACAVDDARRDRAVLGRRVEIVDVDAVTVGVAAAHEVIANRRVAAAGVGF